MSWKKWSIFGSGSVPVIITTRALKSVPVPEVSRVLEECGAILRHQPNESGSFVCELPVRRFVGFGYPRALTLPCEVVIQASSGHDVVVSAACDAARLRVSKQRLFYFWSILFGVIGVIHMLNNGWDVGTAVFMALPWPAVEANFLYDRWRLSDNSAVRPGD